MLKYPCLILDHDDTVVNSTATIHYPALQAYMAYYHKPLSMTLEEYFAGNFDPGIVGLFRDVLGLSEKEFGEEEEFWKNYVKNHIPEAYPGMKELLWRFRELGGVIVVASHSFNFYIERDYEANGLPKPDGIYGWELPKHLRKPDPYALTQTMEKYGFSPEELLVVDDLKPGHDMAKAAGAVFAAAGWANDIPVIERFMRANADLYFKKVEDLRSYLELD